MSPEWVAAGAAVISLIVSLMVGLLVWAGRAERATLQAKLEVVRVEVRASIAEAVNEFYVRVNGNYVKKDVCKIAMAGMEDRINQIREATEG